MTFDFPHIRDTRRPSTRVGRRYSGFVGVMVFACLAGTLSSEAWGTCGDWLDHSSATLSDSVNHSDSSPVDTADTSPTPLETPAKPCDGPQCRRAPSAPLLPVPVQMESSQREVAYLRSLLELTLLSPRLDALDDHDAHATSGFPFRHERPPKV